MTSLISYPSNRKSRIVLYGSQFKGGNKCVIPNKRKGKCNNQKPQSSV